LERYYREEASSRYSMLAERLNRARYFWERDKKPEPPKAADELGRLPPLARPAPQRPSHPAPPAAAAAPAAAPAPRRPSIQTVAMTEEERTALGSLAKPAPAAAPAASSSQAAAPAAPPAMAPSLPTLASIDEVEAAFTRTHEREEVARIALSFLARSYRRAALFQVSKDKVSAWMGQGELDLPIFQKFSISLDQPSLFLNLRNGSSLHFGPLPPMPAHRELARAWGGELPRDAVALPVRINERVVAVLYADGGLKAAKSIAGMGGIDLPHLQRLAAATGAALERCILHRKRAEAKS
ncbi:MAG TPA: hypothetical protein VNW71_05235, partial [Thermoanaerobaculia bacterium]|nr:hypothetical protein [Thermoanaerobaculia bacterium]